MENSRTPTNKIYRKTLLNLGHNYCTIQENEWKSLTTCIENILAGVIPLLPLPDHIEREAQRIANLLIKKHGKESSTINNGKHYETIDIESIENSDVRSVGAEHLAYETVKNTPASTIRASRIQSKASIYSLGNDHRMFAFSC